MSHLFRKRRGRFPSGVPRALMVGLAAIAPGATVDAQPASPSNTIAYSSRKDYDGPLVLRLPASARMLGMANAGVASNDADALLYSPGMLTQARGVAMSLQRYGATATAGSFASVQTLGSLSVAVGAQHLQFSADPYDPVASVQQGGARLADGGAVLASSTAFTVGVGRAIRSYRFGAALKYAEERVDTWRDGVAALDIGLHKAFGQATLAVSLQNIGAGLDLQDFSGPLPTRLTIGYGGGLFPVWEKWDIGMQTQVSVERDGFVRPAGGVELGYVPIEGVALVMRSGLRLPREQDEPLATAGLGITVDRFSFDYALEPMRGGRPVSHRVGFRIK